MARSIEQVLADARAKTYDARGKNIRGSYRFDIAGVGSYRVEVDHGHMSFREDGGPADCVITVLEASDFPAMLDGEQNVLTALMQGRIRVDGDLALAKAFHGAAGQPREREEGVHA